MGRTLLWFVNGTNRRDANVFVDDIVESFVKEKGFHDWQQSTVEATYYIEKLTQPDELVVDPFCGGGTTAVAACRLRRKWQTYEINEDSVHIARERIMNERTTMEAIPA